MKNKSIILILVLVLPLWFTRIAAGQSAQTASDTAPLPFKGDVKSVSMRIAGSYGADTLVVERFVQAAIHLESRIGLSAPVVIAIAIHESSFKSELFTNAGNPFGIKASKPWTGPVYIKEKDPERIPYRVYGSAEEAIWDLGNFVKSRSWYADVFDCPMDDSRCVIDGLKKTEFEPGYSTNPGWDEAIMTIIQKCRLQELVTQ